MSQAFVQYVAEQVAAERRFSLIAAKAPNPADGGRAGEGLQHLIGRASRSVFAGRRLALAPVRFVMNPTAPFRSKGVSPAGTPAPRGGV